CRCAKHRNLTYLTQIFSTTCYVPRCSRANSQEIFLSCARLHFRSQIEYTQHVLHHSTCCRRVVVRCCRCRVAVCCWRCRMVERCCRSSLLLLNCCWFLLLIVVQHHSH